MPTPINPSFFPQFIYGLHDLGGQDRMLNAGRPGWYSTPSICNPNRNQLFGADECWVGVIVRLNHGYDTTERFHRRINTIYSPHDAPRMSKTRRRASLAHRQRMNISAERPQLPDGSREVITAEKYAQCFLKCRTAIKNVPGHTGDLVLTGAPGPYNAETGDWVQYLVDILNRLERMSMASRFTRTRTSSPPTNLQRRYDGVPFQNRHFNFRAYRDYMNAIPAQFRSLPF